MTTVLITGATGFVGKKLITHLRSHGDFKVRAFCRDRLALREYQDLDIAEGDVLNISSISSALIGVDVVVHLAAVMDFFPENKEHMYRTNVQGTRNVVEACTKNGNIKRLIYVSSTETYGAVQGSPATEDSPYHPTSDYGRSKIEAEASLRELAGKKLPYIILKPSGIFGPGDDFVIFEMMQMVHHGILFFVPGSGDKHLTFIYIDDMVDAITKVTSF